MEEIINDLEKKQTEIYTDIEDYEEYTDWTEEYANGYTEGYINAFDLAIEIVNINKNSTFSKTTIQDFLYDNDYIIASEYEYWNELDFEHKKILLHSAFEKILKRSDK